MAIFDASALLAFLNAEPGADLVESRLLERGGRCGAANWSEVAQKVQAHDGDWGLARGLLLSYGLAIEAVTIDDAELAAGLWQPGRTLSLADRLCLALGARLAEPILTADRDWTDVAEVELIR